MQNLRKKLLQMFVQTSRKRVPLFSNSPKQENYLSELFG